MKFAARCLVLGLFISCCTSARLEAQAILSGRVVDALTGKPLPFATVKDASQPTVGTVTDIDGNFDWKIVDRNSALITSHLGYLSKTLRVISSTERLLISLQPGGDSMREVAVRPQYDKIRRLLNAALAMRAVNNPDQLDKYRCVVYYKVTADMDFTALGDDSAEKQKIKAFTDQQHLLVAETYSRRYWARPAKLHEEIVATRFSGLQKAALTNLVTNVLPFHVQSDFIRINDVDYPNPIARGYDARYRFNISDEFLDGSDTVWVLSFFPKEQVNGLRGRVFLNSSGYAPYRFEATATEKALGHIARIEHQSTRITGRWFPSRINYVLDWKDPKSKLQTAYIRGTSRIDSVSYDLPPGYRFDKAHTSSLLPGAETTPDSAWPQYRTDTFTAKDARTYEFNDSFAASLPTDNISRLAGALPAGKFPLGPFDINLIRLYSYNGYEGTRWGFGLQTADKISKKLSVGAWAGYGNLDFRWKYGGFAEFYAGKYRETIFRIAYDNDLRDPGRVFLNNDLDKGYIRQYLIQRADALKMISASVATRLGYWNVAIEGRKENIEPLYDYALVQDGRTAKAFAATEGTLRLRYAFGEQTAVAFGKYSIVGSKYPVAYGVLTTGSISEDGSTQKNDYIQALLGIQWTKHLNRLGTQRYLVLGGKSWSDETLPLTKLFAGRGYRYDRYTAYTFGNLYTLRPYDAYTDAFVSGHLRHDFDFRLWKTSYSTPTIGLGYNILYGTLQNASAQRAPSFIVPNKPYQEAGVVLNDLLRVKYLRIAFITLHAGYFHPLTTAGLDNSGVAVVGLGVVL